MYSINNQWLIKGGLLDSLLMINYETDYETQADNNKDFKKKHLPFLKLSDL